MLKSTLQRGNNMHELQDKKCHRGPITSSDATLFVAGSRGEAVEEDGGGKNFLTTRSPFDWKPMKGDRLKVGSALFIVRGLTPEGNYICFRCNDKLTMLLEESTVSIGIRNGDITVLRD